MTHNHGRRQFIKAAAVGVVGAGVTLSIGNFIVSPPDVESADPYPNLPDQEPAIPPYNSDSLFFDEHQYALVATLAAIIIPTDDDPGASECHVVDFIDNRVAESKQKQAVYTKGLKWLDQYSQDKYGKGKDFLSIGIERQIDLLRSLHKIDSMRSRPVSTFLELLDRKIKKSWDDLLGIGPNSRFFWKIYMDVLDAYLSNPASWKAIGYFGPPQPVGYPDFSEPPSTANYTGSIRHVRNASCLNCHAEGKHPRGKLINHTCKTCHRPHKPWQYNKEAFHVEDRIEFMFPSPDRKKEASN